MNKFAEVPEFEFEPGDDKEYELEAIQDSAVYVKEADGHLLGLYYLVAWKSYPEEKNMETFLNSHTPLEDGQHLLQRSTREIDSDISTIGLRSAHGQANNLAPRKAKMKATNKTS